MTLSQTPTAHPTIQWQEGGVECSARWRSERGALPPKKVVLADDTLSADTAYRMACEGTALLWRGDFQNARQMLQALGRRIDQSASTDKRGRKPKAPALQAKDPQQSAEESAALAAKGFHQHRQAQAQRARVLGMVLLSFDADYGLSLRRSPDARQACAQAWGEPVAGEGASVASMRELLGLVSAYEWRKNGVEIAALGEAPHNRIYPHYGVYSPLRGEYIALVAVAHTPKDTAALTAFDIGTGTGVLAAVLVRRGVGQVVATDNDARALACAAENLAQLGVADKVQLQQADLFPQGLADIIVCNPPWLPARASSSIEHAVYDEGSAMLLGFLKGLAAHLRPKGEGWLILSDLAEHLGLRTRAELLAAIASAGLQVKARIDAKPQHAKARDATDPLHLARAVEVTSLYRLVAAPLVA
ncbi:methyltransferase [Rhodoferax lacus]|uniref:Methyltransferase n=1 Tax=Rhodoferax lacus TaxID=2184758 RepID=A0A3E1R8C5_9BURK|nr:class I SAM-dependent methyltransferase [Rhodoferax lacus]RFO95493.1 methyltransferase [Rhodoferax lacus]